MSEPQMCDFTDWHSEHDFTWDGLNVRHCPGRYAIIPLKPRAAPGSSVPEAARAAAQAAWNATKAEPGGWDANVIRFLDAALAAAAPFIVAAAVAEERATTGRVQALLDEVIEAARFEAQERLDQHHARAFAERELAALQGRIEAVAMELENAADEKIATTSARDLEHISHQALRVAAGKVRAALAIQQQIDYEDGRWCGQCRYGVLEDPPCCTKPAVSS